MNKILRHLLVNIVSFTFFLPLFGAIKCNVKPNTFWSTYIDLHLDFIDWTWKGYDKTRSWFKL